MNEIIKTVLHPDNFGNKDLYPKTSIDQVDGLEERLNEQKAIEIKQVALTGESGTLTEEELATLQSQEINQIVCDNEIFRLMDNQAESGYLVYGHVGVMSSKQTVKTITITISTLGWILQSSVLGESGGGEYYLHRYWCSITVENVLYPWVRLICISKDKTPYNSIAEYYNAVKQDISQLIGDGSGYFPTEFSIDYIYNTEYIILTFYTINSSGVITHYNSQISYSNVANWNGDVFEI